MAEIKDKLVNLEDLKAAIDQVPKYGIATVDEIGVSKPDGESIDAASDGTLSVSESAFIGVESGPVCRIDDALAATPLGVTAFGQTRQNLWVNPSGTKNGVTVTSNEDGSLTVSGTSSGVSVNYAEIFSLVSGKSYTLQIDKLMPGASGNAYFRVEEYSGQDYISSHNVGIGSQLSNTFSVGSSSNIFKCGIRIADGYDASGTYRVMLREATEDEIAAAQSTQGTLQEGGTTDIPQDRPVTLPAYPDVLAEAGSFDWVKPGINGAEPEAIVTTGKNLWRDFTNDKVSAVEGGGIHVAIGDSTWAASGKFPLRLKKGDQITLSKSGTYQTDSSTGPGMLLYDQNLVNVDGGNFNIYSSTTTKTITLENDVFFAECYFNGKTTSERTIYVQLESGSTATAYEPPAVTHTSIDLKGHQLHMLPDGTRDELRIDGTGAVTLVQRVGSVTFDGETYKVAAAYNNGNQLNTNVADAITLNVSYNPSAIMICDKMRTGSANNIWVGQYTACGISGDGMVIFHIVGVSTIEDANDWLKSNRPKVIYKLAKEREIPLGSISMPALQSPEANLWFASEIPCDAETRYIRERSSQILELAAIGDPEVATNEEAKQYLGIQ